MTKKNTTSRTRLFTGLVTAIVALANLPVFAVSATNALALSIKNTTVQPEDIAESRNVAVELAISNNQKGFRAGSFGVRYAKGLNYTAVEALTNAGKAFDVVCNPEENLIWFVGGSASEQESASALPEESIVTLYFDIDETINGGDFGLEFVWTGLDGSNAYWYVNTEENAIAELTENSKNGKITFCNPESEALNYTELQLNPDGQEQLQVANASGEIFWFSKNDKVATVDENGVVNAVNAGECEIQALVNNHLLACKVTVLEAYHYDVTGSEELVMTSTETTIVLEYPEVTENVTWISANPDVITVDETGTLHAVKEGTANILATYNGKTYMKKITVNFTKGSRTIAEPTGDITGDGVITIGDVVAANRAVLGKDSVTDAQVQICDFNQNGYLDATDALTIMKIVVGLI